jgi:KDO2-lipid IV(A) lauroyltransferase
MSRKRSRVADVAVYLAVRVLVCLVQMLSYEAALRLARVLAWLAYQVDRRHRLVADDNLRHAFATLDDRQRDALVRAVYRHCCTLLMVMMNLPRKLHPSNWREYIDMPAAKLLLERALSGRPMLMVTGHFGNWELGSYVLGLIGFPSYAIARRLDNPYLDRFLTRFRRNTGQTLLDKSGDFERIEGVLAGGGILGTLADQDAGQRGLFVDFFGRPASTHKAVALLALEHNAPLVVTGVPRVGEPMRYRVEVEDVIYPEEYAGRPDAVRAITLRFTAALERLVRRHPEQYFWLHRRWKHQPKAKKERTAA